MKNLTFKAAMLNDSRTTVNRQSTDGQSQRHCKQTPLSKRWKVLMTLVFLVTFAIGNVWASQTDLISGYTVPDMPTASLDMATQTTFTPDANGWIVFDPYADAANKSTVPAWWKHSSKSTQSATFADDDLTTLAPTAPFITKNTNHFKINYSGTYSGAIRFTGAEKVSFLVHPRSSSANKEVFVALFTYDSNADPTQVQVTGSPKKAITNKFNEIIFEGLTTSTTYVAYIYGGTAGQNAALCEIAIKKQVSTTPAAPAITAPASDPDLQTITQGETKQFTVTATGYPAPTYQWYKNSSKSTTGAEEIDGATAASYTTPSSLAVSDDNYYFYCVATNASGTAQSPYFALKVNELGGDLTAHTPGVYTKAQASGGYGAELINVEDRDYETYYIYSNSGLYLTAGNIARGSTGAYEVITKKSVTDGSAKAAWVAIKANGITTSITPNTQQFNTNKSTAYVKMRNTSEAIRLKVSGYDQFAFYGANNSKSEATKQFTIAIDGVAKTNPYASSNSNAIFAFDLTTGEHYIEISVGGNTSSDSKFYAFSLRLPQCGATAPGDISKGTLSAGVLTLNVADDPASGNKYYWQTSATGTTKVEEGEGKNEGKSYNVNAVGTYYVRSYYAADDCWSAAKSIELTAEDFLAHYAITYNKGAYGTGEIAGGEKVEGVAYTLSSERFTRAGYVQTGWSLTDGGAKAYDLGGSYTTDAAQEFFPVWAETSTYVASFNSGEGCSASTPDGWTFANAGSYGANDATADFECKFGENFPTSAAEVVKNASYIAFAKAAGACATYDLGSATTVSALAGTFYVGSGNERTFTIEYLAANGTTVLHTISTTTNTNWGEKAVNDATVVPNVKYIRINPAHAGSSYSWLVMKAFSVTYVDLVTKYNVSFDKNGGSGDDMAMLRYAEDALVTLPGCTFTAPTNKTFDAWTSEDVEISSNQFTMPNKNVTIKATWKFLPKLTLTAGEGATGDDVVAYYAAGTQISVPEKPAGFSNGTKDFTGWVYSQAVPIEADKFAMPSTDLTLTAQWASATAVAQILGGDSYETFADAIAAVAAGQTIQLLADCSYDAAWNLTVAGTVTLDLNGKNLTYTGSGRGVQVHNGAKLILEDGTATVAPTIDLTADPLSRSAITYTSGTFDSKDGMCALAGGEIEINSGTYLATEGVVLVAGNAATVTVNDGVLISRDNAVLMGNGSNNDNYRNYTMNVHGGILLGEIFSAGYASMVIYHPNVGKLNIDGGTLVSTNGPAVVCRGGESNITGGTIVAQGSGSGKCGDASLVLPAVGVAYDFKSAYPGVSSFDAKISGDANVSGAAGAVQGIYAGATPTTAEKDAVAISAGTFNSPVAQALCAEGYIPSAEIAPGKYGVIATAKSVDFTASDVQALDVGTAMSTYNYTLASISGVSFDKTNAYDTGLKMKNSTTNTLSFVVEPGKLVTIVTGNIAGMTYSVNGGAASALNGGTDKDHLGYTYLYNDAVQNIVLAETNTTYNIIRKITITDPYEVSFDVNGGDEIAAQYFYGTALTLPGATKGTESFLGWFDGETKVGEAGDKYTPTANITLKAYWEAISTDARLASITFSSNAGTLSPAFDPEVTNYTYTMPYVTAAIPTITGATKANPAAKDPVIDAQATAWGETAHVHGVAASDDTKDYYVQMLRAPKDGTCIVKADLAPGSSAASITATSGAYKDADNIAININKDLKLGGTGAYVKVAVKDTYFQDGDVVEITLASDKNVSAWLQIFADEGTTLVAEMTSGVSNASPNYLTISGVPANTSALYLYRTETAAGNMNPYPTSMAVTRPMNPMLTAITINGRDGEIDPLNDKHFNVLIPYDADLANLTIVDEVVWNAPAATDARIVVSNSGNWEIGDNTYRLTDKDGDYTDYIITLTRDVKKYTVTFDAQGGSTVEPKLVVENTKLDAAPADPTREDYQFLGWAEATEGEVVDVTDIVISANKTFYAQWKYEDPIVMLDGDGHIDHVNFLTGLSEGTVNFGSADHNCVSFGSTASTIVGATGSNKFIVYNAKTTQTRIKFVLYNTQSSSKNIVLQKVAEGETAPTNVVIEVPSQQQFTTEYYAYNSDENRSMYVYTENTGIKVLQVKVIESGTPIHQAGQAGYVLNLNKGRVFAPSNEDVEFEGLSMKVSSNYKVLNSEVLQTENNLSFQVNELVTMTLVSTGAKYKVSKNPAGSGKEYAAGTNKHTLTQGTWYIVSSTGSNMKFTNISFEEPVADHTRDNLNPSFLGTLCWTNDAILGGATLYEFAGKNENNYLVFDEVEENRLEAGKPYIFMPENGNTEIKVYNIDESDPMTESQLQPVNNMYGTLDGKTLVPGVDDNMYYFSSNHIWAVKDFTVNIPILPNRCYIDYPAVLAADPAPAAAPGRRRVTMGVNGQNVATGMGEIEASETPMKVMINGQIFIIRGEKMFDATGRLVK